MWYNGRKGGTDRQMGMQAKRPEVFEISELTEEEIANSSPAREGSIAKLRDVHHRIARLKAMGYRNFEIANAVGYSQVRISTLLRGPAMEGLVEGYRREVDQGYQETVKDYWLTDAKRVELGAISLMAEITDEARDGNYERLRYVRPILAMHDSVADRTGHGKHITQTNVNVEFYARLDRAVARTQQVQKQPKLIEGKIDEGGI